MHSHPFTLKLRRHSPPRRFRPPLWLALVLLCLPSPSQADPVALPAGSVMLGGQTVFTIHTAIGPFSAAERAAAAGAKLNLVMKDLTRDPAAIHPDPHSISTDIVSNDLVLTTVTDADASAMGMSREVLVALDINLMREALVRVRGQYTYKSLSLGAVYAVLATLALVALLLFFRRLFPRIYASIEQSRGTHLRSLKVQSLELLSEERLVDLLLQLVRFVRLAVTVLLLYFYIPLVFSFFPWTRSYGSILFGYIASPIAAGWTALVNYLPNLLVVCVIFFFAWLALRLTGWLFREIERGSITWSGFYPEWAMPTRKIVQLFLLAFALVIVFPYLPGSSSPAFKGVSIFLGVLFSLGSSSAVANVVSGVLLTYTRAFNVGDRVQIVDAVGDVIEKGLLATQIRTIKNVLVTIPNALVLGSHIVNFSRSTESQPLILHVTVTIGYDAPWRQVHQLLIAAAAATPGILADPPPFVLQTSLDDFYVSYQVNACTEQPSRMATIYSALNQNIQDHFNDAGVEIMSPHYNSLRDGNATAIPAASLPPNYQPNPFRVASARASRFAPAKPGSE